MIEVLEIFKWNGSYRLLAILSLQKCCSWWRRMRTNNHAGSEDSAAACNECFPCNLHNYCCTSFPLHLARFPTNDDTCLFIPTFSLQTTTWTKWVTVRGNSLSNVKLKSLTEILLVQFVFNSNLEYGNYVTKSFNGYNNNNIV